MNHRPAIVSALLLLCCVAPAQEDRPQEPQKLTEWPKLKKTDADKVRAIVKQFRKKDEKLHAPAADKLATFGAGAAPILLKMVNDRSGNVNVHLFGVLDRIVDEQHAALLAREASRHSVEWRRYLMMRLSRFHDASLVPVLEKAVKDKDEDVQFHAGLGLLALHQESGLEPVLFAARKRWNDRRAEIEKVLTPARAREGADIVVKRIAQARTTEQMAGLRLLRYLLPKKRATVLRTYLQASDFAVKRAAINAARVVNGEKPLEKLASFQAINMAKEWLKKL